MNQLSTKYNDIRKLKKIIKTAHADNYKEEIRRYQILFEEVINRAISDAINNSRKKLFRFEKIKAIKWLRDRSEDFLEVCRLANLDPDYIQSKADYYIRNPKKYLALIEEYEKAVNSNE